MLVHPTTAEAENLLPSMIRKGNTRTINWDFLKGENRKEGKKMEVKGRKGVKRRERKKRTLMAVMGVPNSQLTTIFSAKYQLTTIFLANSQLTTNFG